MVRWCRIKGEQVRTPIGDGLCGATPFFLDLGSTMFVLRRGVETCPGSQGGESPGGDVITGGTYAHSELSLVCCCRDG